MRFASPVVILGVTFAVRGAQAAAAEIIEFELGATGFCLSADGIENGIPVNIIPCVRSTPQEITWTVTAGGGSGTAKGPVTTITISSSDGSNKKCLDVTNGVNENGTKLQIWDCFTGNKNQLFQVNGDNTISWANTNKCLDNTNGEVEMTNPTQIWTCSKGNTNQQWVPEPAPGFVPPGGAVRFEMPTFNPNGDGCMTAVENADGAEVIFTQCTFNEPGDSGPSEVWTLTAGTTPPGVDGPEGPLGQITAFGNKCLDVTGGSTANGVKLQIFTCFTTDVNQLWHVDSDQTIRWSNKGKCVDLTNGNKTNGNRLQSWDCGTNNPNQQWLLNPVE